jgi:ribosomal protein S27AE
MALERIDAPWTDEQVAALNRYQKLDHVHPFTCPHIHTLPCPCTENADRTPDRMCHRCLGAGMVLADRALTATNAGWVCPYCNYTQRWAHAVMLKVWPSPREALNGPQEKG